MTIQEILTSLGITPVNGVFLLLFVLSGLIQVSKININPWTKIGDWIRGILLKDVTQSIRDMRTTQMKIQRELSEHIAQSYRRAILDFTTECMNNQDHSQEQFAYIFKIYRKYEAHVKENKLTNDEVNESIAYIRHVYQQHLDEGHF